MSKDIMIAKLTGKLNTYERLLTKASGKSKFELQIKVETVKECIAEIRG